MCKPGEPCPGAENDDAADAKSLAYIKSYDDRVTKAFKQYPHVAGVLFQSFQIAMILKGMMDQSIEDRAEEIQKLKREVLAAKDYPNSGPDVSKVINGITEVLNLFEARKSREAVASDNAMLYTHAIKLALMEEKVPDEVIKANASLIAEALVADEDFEWEKGKDAKAVQKVINGMYQGATLFSVLHEQPARV